VFINAMNLHHRFGTTLKDFFNLMADCRSGLILSKEQTPA
jgi:hypothetical protein